MTKAPTLTEKSKKQCDNIKTQPKTLITQIANRLTTVSWSNISHPNGVVKPVYERSTFPLTTNIKQLKIWLWVLIHGLNLHNVYMYKIMQIDLFELHRT